MRAFEFLLEAEEQEAPQLDTDNFEDLRNALIAKIQRLPADSKSLDFLKLVKDALKKQGTSTRIVGLLDARSVKAKLEKTRDPDRDEQLNDALARFIVSAPGSQQEKRDFVARLAADKLIDKEALFNDGKPNSITNCIIGYKKNPVTTYVVDGLIDDVPQGVGPGEVLMIALSAGITKMKGKGDLMVTHPVDGEVELKTTKKKSPRFQDRAVKAQKDYDQKSDNFVKNYVDQTGVKFPPAGMNLKHVIEAYSLAEDKEGFKTDLTSILDSIYPLAESNTKAAVIEAITSNDFVQAQQLYAKASFQNYKAHKKFKGVLYLNLKNGKTLYYNDWEDITAAGGSIGVGTIYMVAANTNEGPFPQIELRLPID